MTLLIKAFKTLARITTERRNKDLVSLCDVAQTLGDEADVNDEVLLLAAILSCVANYLSMEEVAFEFGQRVADILVYFESEFVETNCEKKAGNIEKIALKIAKTAAECSDSIEYAVTMIILADRYCVLSRHLKCVPEHWTKQHVQGLVLLVSQSLAPLRGISARFDVLFSSLYEKEITLDCQTFRALPLPQSRDDILFALLHTIEE